MYTIKAGLKFCGNCNPQISVKSLLRGIKEETKYFGIDLELLPSDHPDIELLLVISGCPADCAGRPETEIRELVVAGETIDRLPCQGIIMARKVAKNLLQIKLPDR